MTRTTRAAGAAASVLLAVGLLGACSSAPESGPKDSASAEAPPAKKTPDEQEELTAEQVAEHLAKVIPTLKTTLVYTEETDPNNLMGRPGGYTSKVSFSDSRVPAAEVEGQEKDAIARGGSVEVFPTEEGAKRRAEYGRKISESMPALAEYDYQQGTILVRVSKVLPPSQAREYEAALKQLG